MINLKFFNYCNSTLKNKKTKFKEIMINNEP